jgi:hypothetical protein
LAFPGNLRNAILKLKNCPCLTSPVDTAIDLISAPTNDGKSMCSRKWKKRRESWLFGKLLLINPRTIDGQDILAAVCRQRAVLAILVLAWTRLDCPALDARAVVTRLEILGVILV